MHAYTRLSRTPPKYSGHSARTSVSNNKLAVILKFASIVRTKRTSDMKTDGNNRLEYRRLATIEVNTMQTTYIITVDFITIMFGVSVDKPTWCLHWKEFMLFLLNKSKCGFISLVKPFVFTCYSNIS
ncbi:hypothetical protein NP493_25g03001 [Ridgeia piscesae]|uniref:Uncharacterized protein n=1 Tax=Ridgeia piscesae TaxID=27915 RepID=A0AAD9PD73_RIDPI|nr:hypothetical protein NP493_25g03001 [Ridgeia piscesae]